MEHVVEALESALHTNFKANEAPIPFTYGGITFDLRNRQARIDAVNAVTEDIARPLSQTNAVLVERLTDAILYEEISDPDPHKIAHNEYPFMSERQLGLRRDREASDTAAITTGTDGKDHRKPTKRKRTGYENFRIDRDAKVKNAERAAQYKRDTAPGRVHTYNLNETGGELLDDEVALTE